MSSACPICRRPTLQEYRPFCSRRCADEDLQRWLVGAYVIPQNDDEDERSASSDDPSGDEE